MIIRKELFRTICLLTLMILTLSLRAQQDTTQLRFTEETVKEPENKNVRWVPKRRRQYNMDNISSLLKIGTSPLYGVVSIASYSYDSYFLDIGFEKKIPRTQLSLEVRLRTSLGKRDASGYFTHRFYTENLQQNQRSNFDVRNDVGLDLFARYYLLKGRNIRQGKSGNNPYGMYLLAGGINLATWGKETETVFDLDLGFSQPYRVIERKGLNSGPAYAIFGAGYQQRIFKRGYIDVAGGLARNLDRRETYSYLNIYLDVTMGYTIFKIKP